MQSQSAKSASTRAYHCTSLKVRVQNWHRTVPAEVTIELSNFVTFHRFGVPDCLSITHIQLLTWPSAGFLEESWGRSLSGLDTLILGSAGLKGMHPGLKQAATACHFYGTA